MAEAVHVHAQITSQVSTTAHATPETKLTISSTTLSSAGFATNDDVFIFVYVVGSIDTGTTEWSWAPWYGSTLLGGVSAHDGFDTDPNGGGAEQAWRWFKRLDLGGTLQDFTLRLASSDAGESQTVYIDRAEVVIIRADDFGTENTDWFYNESTAGGTMATGPGTWTTSNNASITWTPGSVEDWVVVGNEEFSVNAVDRNTRYRINRDSGTEYLGVNSGTVTVSEEGESGSEEKSFLMFDYLESLSASEHTITNEVEDDATGSNVRLRSALLVFRAAIWTDIYVHEAGTQSVSTDTDTQVATITDTMSTSQNAMIWGHAHTSAIALNNSVYMWVREGGSTVIEPSTSFSNGISMYRSRDNTDLVLMPWQGYKSLSGTLDLDLFVRAPEAISSYKSTLLVWGMNTAAGGDVNLAGAGDASSDAAADLTVEVLLVGAGDAASDESSPLSVIRTLVGAGDAANNGTGHITGDVPCTGAGDAASDAAAALSVSKLLSGHGDAASDAAATLDAATFLAGSGDSAADATAAASVTRLLSGAGDVAGDATGDLTTTSAIYELLVGAGDASSEGSGDLTIAVILAMSFDLPIWVFTADLGVSSVPLTGGLITPSGAAYIPQSGASSPGGTTYVARISDPARYHPHHFGHKRHVVDGGSIEGKVLEELEEV